MYYTTLLIDADDTIFDFPKCEYEALKSSLTSSGLLFDNEIFTSFDTINTELWKKFEKAEITRSDLRVMRFRRLIEECFAGFDRADELADIYIAELSQQAVLLSGTEEALKILAGHFQMYIITNGLKKVQRGRFAISPVSKYFKELFISDELDVQKPDKAFFDIVLSRIEENDRARVLVVGDSLTSDMQGGKNAGLDTCLFDPADRVVLPHPLCDMKIKSLTELLTLSRR